MVYCLELLQVSTYKYYHYVPLCDILGLLISTQNARVLIGTVDYIIWVHNGITTRWNLSQGNEFKPLLNS